MMIKQIDFAEAMELSRTGKKVYVIPNPEKPVIKSFNNLSIGEAIDGSESMIFVVFEEAVESGRS